MKNNNNKKEDILELRAIPIQARLKRFNDILAAVSKQGELTHWKILDMSLITLVMTLEDRGIEGLADKVL